ncbi:hypothetical protein [Dyella sp. EPa41]|uniref:hypothetical protein n=1 Tax=Dyella sp. EPa41 TaxID=1561194 RepID=UPI001915DB74|nr:hypothetical protein [Dyella sp. EPa41]
MADGGNVITLDPARQATKVPPLTSDEILALRQLLRRASAIIDTCPIAKRIIEEGGL